MPQPDVTEDYIRIRQRDPGDFVQDSFRTITLSEDEGIKAVIGKLKSDPDGSTVVQSYLFDKDKWSVSEAKEWVKEHKKDSIDESKIEKQEEQNIERRFNLIGEMRFDDKPEPKLFGYAAVFDVLSEEMFGFREKIAKGAFTKSILKDDVRMLWNHNPDYVLARTKSGTLKLREDNKGLYFEATPPDTQWAKDLLVSIKRKDVTQNSFGFIILDEEWERKEDDRKSIRTLKEVKLYDVSPVTYPAYPQTELHIRGKWGETTLVYKDMKPESRDIFASIFQMNEKAKVNLNHRYGISENVFSATEPNPTIFLTDSTGEQDGKDRAKASFVEPKNQKHLIDPVRWTRYSKYLK